VIVHDAAAAFLAVADAAVLWVEAFAAALAFVLCVAAYSIGLLIAPHARQGVQVAAGETHSPSCATRAAGRPPKPSGGRTGRRVPSWAHTEPYTYDEAA
jgi:hypothetical protein